MMIEKDKALNEMKGKHGNERRKQRTPCIFPSRKITVWGQEERGGGQIELRDVLSYFLRKHHLF